ncbi:redoxin family protein [Streptobacillus canis]|uniref:redoxin family protein n=1 Tax=Streptobacillus canis TaxID=2678686 RepID=UPI0012E1356F|nr:redoxin family protein [Streptobacillus canis]
MNIKKGLLMLILFSTFFVSCIKNEKELVNISNVRIINLNKEEMKIGDIKGKKYIKLWASWCYVCNQTMDHTIELSKNVDFNVLAIANPGHKGEINTDDLITWYRGTKWANLGLTVLFDEAGEIISRTNTGRAYPTNLLVDSEGNVVKILYGAQSNEVIINEMNKIK